jgi:hypothetical protein
VRAFEPSGDGGVRAVFEPVEAALLAQLAGQVAGLLEEQRGGTAADLAILRLLPDAYPDDREASAEFRRFTADELTEKKLHNARILIADCAEVADADMPSTIRLDAASIGAWLRSLTDVRLVLATRLGITDDGDVGPDDDEEALMLTDVYDWLGFVQDSLVSALED